MKKKSLAKILAAFAVATAAFTITGCNFSVKSTSTVTETKTDADGNSVTTTTVKENGKVTSKTTTENTAVTNDEETSDKILATMAFKNDAHFDIQELYFAASDSESWGEDILVENAPLRDFETLEFNDAFTYSEEALDWDLLAYDTDGTSFEIKNLDMSLAQDPENITITFGYNEETEGSTVTVL